MIAGGKIRNNFADGKVVETELKTGDVLYREPQTHWVENIGRVAQKEYGEADFSLLGKSEVQEGAKVRSQEGQE